MMTTVGAPGVPCEACRSSMDGVNQSSIDRSMASVNCPTIIIIT